MEKLALLGGKPSCRRKFKPANPIGKEEIAAATKVLRSGKLSAFMGSPGPQFLGGPRIQEFERKWAKKYGVKHAVSVNSATSGLIAAAGACGLGPGDEIIVTPATMVATATAAVMYGAVPVFSDIERETFNLDPTLIEKAITPRTKAIFVTHLFGHPAEMDEIMNIAARRGLRVVEDAAQSPAAKYREGWAGCIGDLGVFSLNYHKHVHTGEGGVVVTNDDELAERVRLIRNHGEACVEASTIIRDLTNTMGGNYRLTELQAAIGTQQLAKVDKLVRLRQKQAAFLARGLKGIPSLELPVTRRGTSHAYYCYITKYNDQLGGVPIEAVARALQSEGLPWSPGYARPVYWAPMYQKRIAFKGGLPWAPPWNGEVSYSRGTCPVSERVHTREILGIELCLHEFTEDDLRVIVKGTRKVFDQLDLLGRGG